MFRSHRVWGNDSCGVELLTLGTSIANNWVMPMPLLYLDQSDL